MLLSDSEDTEINSATTVWRMKSYLLFDPKQKSLSSTLAVHLDFLWIFNFFIYSFSPKTTPAPSKIISLRWNVVNVLPFFTACNYFVFWQQLWALFYILSAFIYVNTWIYARINKVCTAYAFTHAFMHELIHVYPVWHASYTVSGNQ